ncbi:hypothetical protein COLO4_30274 [Corchorus olitorius]|uniref:Late embryogenesis abundant protein, LEA-14 n=1 Tax=Corchorus olitorius TaxID=93759 RepID=A0A1R3H9F6_9ROSI|nr:hypothetical protein COLO4_30274 [Corchorus olitorius]
MQSSRKSDDSDLEQGLESEESTAEQSSSKLNWRNVAKLAAALVVIALIITFAVLVFTTKTPRFQLSAVMVDHLNSTTSPNPSFNMRLTAHMTVHNPNYGYFSYGMTIVNLAYRGVDVGQACLGLKGKGQRCKHKKDHNSYRVEFIQCKKQFNSRK